MRKKPTLMKAMLAIAPEFHPLRTYAKTRPMLGPQDIDVFEPFGHRGEARFKNRT